MQEDFLHYIWKHKKFTQLDLKTTTGESIVIHSVGTHNHNSGPDFFNAQIRIDNQLWAGNVEIHINTNDWFLHHHEKDVAYDNVILHVVWEDDGTVYRKDNTEISTLELKQYVSSAMLHNYEKLFTKKGKWINCEQDFANIGDFTIKNWLERLYFERLERKSKEIEVLLENSKNNWEEVLFKMLVRAFGLKVNGDAFFSLANSFEFSVLRKVQSNPIQLEALLFGQSSLLETDIQDAYVLQLKSEYQFLKQKFSLSNNGVMPLQFFRLRPLNFPTVRLSQLASAYHRSQNLFSELMSAENIQDIYNLVSVETSTFWETHYTFSKTSKKRKKKVTNAFIDLLIINAILPLKFCYAKHQGKQIDDIIVQFARAITTEKNSIVDAFNQLKKVSTSALESQALLQLKSNYCDKNKCLQCAVGSTLLTQN